MSKSAKSDGANLFTPGKLKNIKSHLVYNLWIPPEDLNVKFDETHENHCFLTFSNVKHNFTFAKIYFGISKGHVEIFDIVTNCYRLKDHYDIDHPTSFNIIMKELITCVRQFCVYSSRGKRSECKIITYDILEFNSLNRMLGKFLIDNGFFYDSDLESPQLRLFLGEK